MIFKWILEMEYDFYLSFFPLQQEYNLPPTQFSLM